MPLFTIAKMPRSTHPSSHDPTDSRSKSKPPPSTPHLIPLPLQPLPHPRNPENAGNTCYLDSVLISLFAEQDISDSLLTRTTDSEPHQTLRQTLRIAVNHLRRGEAIPKSDIRSLRDALIKLRWYPGAAQQDAAELYAFLLDHLDAPFLPLFNNLAHSGVPDVGDHAPSTERLLWLDVKGIGDLPTMLNDYFFGQVRKGLRRGSGHGVDALVMRSLIPSYTPIRETGEIVSARRDKFRYLTVPLAINRFRARGNGKDRSPVHVRTALDATSYVNCFADDAKYTLILRSVVCHIGSSISAGHYVCYTFEPAVGWRRWNDLDSNPVRAVRGDVLVGLPEDANWREEIERDCYLLFYELVPGDGEDRLKRGRSVGMDIRSQIRADEQLARQTQTEEDHVTAMTEHFANGGGASVMGEPVRPFKFW
eukprot:GFKZ01001169.1.p1 GENE.GFKZ01001169.1~~GFKZ01001169.1.p1  ORF type:complete len:422 (-),score=40.90 GFKZ01001169.1:1506-2771(-)